jgi:hypothetical protein
MAFREVPVLGVVPVDVDTWQDYEGPLALDEPTVDDPHGTKR